jgi:hypothetical protein
MTLCCTWLIIIDFTFGSLLRFIGVGTMGAPGADAPPMFINCDNIIARLNFSIH